MSSLVQRRDAVLAARIIRWARGASLGRRAALAVVALSVICGVATYVVLTGSTLWRTDPGVVRGLLLADLLMLLTVGGIVARRLVAVWVARWRGSAGSRLHIRMVTLFSIVAIAPTIIVAAFAVLFFETGLQGWFSKRVQTAVTASVAVAEAYVEEHRQTVRADVLAMAIDLNRAAPALLRKPRRFNQVVSAQAALRSLSEAVVFDSTGQVLARSALSFVIGFETVPPAAVRRAQDGEVAVVTAGSSDRVRALVRLDAFPDAYLYVGRFVEPRVIEHVNAARRARTEYERLQQESSGIEITFALIFAMVAVLLLLASVWLGLLFATQLAQRIGGVIGAAERIGEGDLGVRVLEGGNDDLGTLGRAFNRMAGQLHSQRGQLLRANRQLDDRRRFMETVLSGVTAGVIGLERRGRIELPNLSAMELLGASRETLVGQRLDAAVPEMAELFDQAQRQPGRIARGQVNIQRDGRTRNLMVRIATERKEEETLGFVVTFDDITELVSAQRTAAWADVARRIAHEIKNPLTPIQLAAERLKRKYRDEISTEPEIFAQCTDTIIRQVGDIGHMVDEFSAFARMPAPVFRDINLGELVRQEILMQRVANPGIEYVSEIAEGIGTLRGDGGQIAQALANLLKNGAESVSIRLARENGAAGEAGRVTVGARRIEGAIEIDVIDNGVGLPAADRERLTEPYVTHRAKGTGLGLAIVNKVMEEHGGTLRLDDAPGGGARARLVFPTADRDTAGHDDQGTGGAKRLASHGA